METESSLHFCAEDMRNNLPQYQIVPHIVSSTGLFRKVNPFIQHKTCAQYPDGVSHEKYWDTERECCLLVLNLVSSTLPCIRQPRPRLTDITAKDLRCGL